MAKRRRQLAVIAVCAAIGLAGCGSKAEKAGPSPTTPPTTASVATTTTTTTTIAAPTTTIAAPTTVASRAGFTAARAAWKKGAQDVAAVQPGDWLQAVTDLQSGLVHDTGNTSAYAGAIAELQYIASLPDTDVPASEAARERADVTALNTFFDTPGLYD
jgi:hypothetical protein